MRIIEGNFDALVEAFGASRRLATRLGALARAGLLVTETVLEFAAAEEGKPLSQLLLAKSLLDGAAALDDAALEALCAAGDAAFFAENPLALRRDGERRVLCLAEEAPFAPAAPAPAAGTQALAVAQEATSPVLAPEEARRLLGAEEVSRLKLDLVTSAEPGRRLEALRKLYLSGLAGDEKVRLFLTALRDRDAAVRAEAARALGAAGLDSGLTENLARAFAGTPPERVVAVANLGQVLKQLDAPQRALAHGALLEFVAPGEAREVLLGALGVLASNTPDFALQGPRLHRALLDLLQVKLHEFEEPARKVYAALYRSDRAGTSALLCRSVAELAVPGLRYFVLSTICEHDLEAAAAPEVIEQLVIGLCSGSELDRNVQACSGALVRLGDRAVEGLLRRLLKADEAGRRRIVDLLGHLRREGSTGTVAVSAASVRAMAQAVLDLYPTAGAEVRSAILESGIFEHADLEPALRAAAAVAFIDSLHEFRFERQVELVQIALERLGHAAVEPLFQAMQESGHDVTRLSAALLLPRIIEKDTEIDEAGLVRISGAMRAIVEAEDSGFPDRGPLYLAMGRIGGHAAFSAARADEQAAVLRAHVGRSSAVYDVLEALGWLAAGANVSAIERLEVGYLLLNVLKKGLPSPSARLRRNAEGEAVLHFGRETTAYTDMVPRLLEGLGRMLEAPRTPEALFLRISRELITLWSEVTDYRRVWAPAATMTLARLLGQIALGARRPEQMVHQIADLLTRRLILLPVLQVLARLIAANPEADAMNAVAARAFTELSRRLTQEPLPEFVERRQILETMTAIVLRPRLGDRERDIEHARRVTVEALFDALRNKMFQARGMLEQIVAGKHMSETLRTEVQRRLKPAAGRA
ncbi:MAG: hypothetical protein IT463_00245 [Planctomycetes bacterium]|nr:hypothetical protein [Planctomycetota bacterium]